MKQKVGSHLQPSNPSKKGSVVSPEYFCNLDPNSYRLDHLQRPELNKGTVDFVVTSNNNYWAQHPPPRLSLPYFNPMPPAEGSRTPAPMDYIFAFDVSRDAQTSGFLQAACDSVRTVLYGGTYGNNVPLEASFPPASRVAILTFDSAIHFYDLSVRSFSLQFITSLTSTSRTSPQCLLLATWKKCLYRFKVDYSLVLTKDGELLLFSPATPDVQARPSIEMLLGAVTQRFAAEPSSTSCLGSAIRACLGAMVLPLLYRGISSDRFRLGMGDTSLFSKLRCPPSGQVLSLVNQQK